MQFCVSPLVHYDELLKNVRVARPCPADWETMRGDERSRYCGLCGLNVYNLSAITAREAAQLIRRKEGRMCALFYRRKDGTVLTSDCGHFWKGVRKRWAVLSSVFVPILGFAFYLFWLGHCEAPSGSVEWIRLGPHREPIEEHSFLGRVITLPSPELAPREAIEPPQFPERFPE